MVSLADFCFGADCVEIRLPWLLLNVGDPAAMGVHRDYYQYYGVEFKQIQAIWVGAAREDEENAVPIVSLRVKGWRYLDYRERLKDSYYIIQSNWKGDNIAAVS